MLKTDGNVILFKRSKNLMASIVFNEDSISKVKEAEESLEELLSYMENMCIDTNKAVKLTKNK
jgi:hypothetical protein